MVFMNAALSFNGKVWHFGKYANKLNSQQWNFSIHNTENLFFYKICVTPFSFYSRVPLLLHNCKFSDFKILFALLEPLSNSNFTGRTQSLFHLWGGTYSLSSCIFEKSNLTSHFQVIDFDNCTVSLLSRHRWGQVTRVCPGMWQMPQVRAFLAAGGLLAVASPVIFLPFFHPSPPALNPPPKPPEMGNRGWTEHEALEVTG